jgi:hypothetical protein
LSSIIISGMLNTNQAPILHLQANSTVCMIKRHARQKGRIHFFVVAKHQYHNKQTLNTIARKSRAGGCNGQFAKALPKLRAKKSSGA